ncbi:hypothetical protein PF005_g25297 [Phytophthora fragariae]|uniref:RxLR effector protein n=1 Tax=Phytophthora fragariae TaxID=53985 RepID=A0A6A3QW05_9STRA|nr:hypothetical protein PF003_g32736 [Phytophthora fragariae]KAE8929978.1 hypothetical protein PF009_g19920 [Phytophthora fragariae]KAE9082741.1 hypothetical protein PF007_g22183 [Phytophthora fragariae]KAE9109606.1 hypothetical protein PF006_g20633 [Phytophthora fragariae]KAE9175672.1 hypothetical protein PF005_g25297 [Phytophthora fragariae]
MRLQQVLLVVVVSFLSSTVALSTATENEQSKGSTLASPLSGRSIVGHDGATGRSLRARDVIDTEDKSTEDRGLWTHVKVRWWLETEKTDDYVKEALKLNGLKGEALTQNKNYKAYQYFVKKSEEFKLNKWYRHEFSTFQGWKEVGFVKITKASDLDKIRDTKQFSVYKDYVNYLDNYLFQGLKAGYSPPAAMVRRGTSEAELTARTEIMAEAGRSVPYAKVALGMTDARYPKRVLYGEALERHEDFNYFILFLEEKAPAIRNELKKFKNKNLGRLSGSQKRRHDELVEELDLVEKYVKRK